MAALDKARAVARGATPEALETGRNMSRKRLMWGLVLTFALAMGAIWTEWHWQFLATAMISLVVATGYAIIYGVFVDEAERRRLEEMR